MSSVSGSDSERSVSPIHQGPAPTPGHGLDRSRSNSPQYNNKSQDTTPARSISQSRSASAASNSRSRSGSPRSGIHSPASQRSQSPVSQTSRKSRSRSVASQRSRSRSDSGSKKSRSRSGSGQSKKSVSSSGGSRSGSVESNRSRSRSKSAGSNRSKSGDSHRSKSGDSHRSKSGDSHRSKSGESHRSRSPASNRSKSIESNRSKSPESNRSGSRSRSNTPPKRSGSNSRSNSPHLQIDEPGSPSNSNNKSEEKKREDSEDVPSKKINELVDSESEIEEKDDEDKGVSAAAIFGDADDISSEDDKEKDERRSDEEERHSDGENVERVGDEIDEDKENEPEPIPETRIDVEIPKISCDLGRDIHFVKLPNFLSVETRPFDPETYEDEIDEEETLDEEGRARLKLKVENTMRWKETVDKEGNIKKESNARLVRWSDGSYSLHLGSEIFDVYKQPLQGDHNHLFIRQGTGLQGQAVFRTKLSFRPHSTESFTHRKMTLSLADRSQKTSGIKILSQVGVDPDHDRKNLLKKEEEKLKQTVRVSKPRKKGDSGTRSHNTSSVYREEEGSDEEGISLNAIKNKYKSAAMLAAKGGAIYSSDEEGSDFEARRGARKLDKAKVLKDSESSEASD